MFSLDKYLLMRLRAPVCKNQTKSKFGGKDILGDPGAASRDDGIFLGLRGCGKGGKFDFFRILMLDRLGYN